MFSTIFQSIFENNSATVIPVENFLACVGVTLVIGVFLSLAHGFRTSSSKSFQVTLALLPAIVCVVIMMVNGNIGAGVAVAGAFSLVRFRSVPGTAREIGSIFLAMGTGLIAGMGYLGYAALFAFILGVVMFLLNLTNFGAKRTDSLEKALLITIPEDLNYNDAFDDLFTQFTSRHEMLSVKTTNMGSLFKLHYLVSLKNGAEEKAFIDALRCRNGNLEINLFRQEANQYEL